MRVHKANYIFRRIVLNLIDIVINPLNCYGLVDIQMQKSTKKFEGWARQPNELQRYEVKQKSSNFNFLKNQTHSRIALRSISLSLTVFHCNFSGNSSLSTHRGTKESNGQKVKISTCSRPIQTRPAIRPCCYLQIFRIFLQCLQMIRK